MPIAVNYHYPLNKFQTQIAKPNAKSIPHYIVEDYDCNKDIGFETDTTCVPFEEGEENF